MLEDFLSNHSSTEKVISIQTEPKIIYLIEEKDSLTLNFDFLIQGLSNRNLYIRFLKAAIYDENDNLITFKHLNHNSVGNPSINTLGKFSIEGKSYLDIFNPFFRFPKNMPIKYLRYMFTLRDKETNEEFYYGNIIVKPVRYKQKVKLSLPLKEKLVILDGCDFYSHHRRVALSILREFTNETIKSNFNRYGLDLSVLGEDGNLRKMTEDEKDKNYDFHFTDIRNFYTHEAIVYAPADGEIVDVVDNLEDLYNEPFNTDEAAKENRLTELAGNYIIIKHNDSEYSHLYHLLKGSCKVKIGDKVKRDQEIAKIGFSGASNVYSHLHYQLLDGSDIFNSNELPVIFTNVIIWQGAEKIFYKELTINTGDIIVRATARDK
ncbi:MAG: M23 family metallopeptidase [Asgard group archaeon]|nr:M23 family metallopeptidase [Asgard group archaeon]